MVVRELINLIGFRVDEGARRQALSSIKSLSTELSNIGLGMSAAITTPLTAIATMALRTSSSLEKTKIAYDTLLGSATEADKLIRDTIEFAKETPFQLPGVQENAQALLAMGIEVEKIIPTLNALGNAAAGVNRPLSRIAFNYGQVRTQQRLTGRDLRDFAILGVPILDALAETMGVTTKQVTEMTSAGEVGFDKVEKAFMAMSDEGGKFYNLMKKQATTLAGLWSNLIDSTIMLRKEIGDSITEVFNLKGVVRGLMEAVQRLTDWFKSLTGQQRRWLFLLAALAMAIGPVAIGLWALTKIIILMSSPMFLLAVAITVVIAAFGLLVEDIVRWVQGGDSLIGAFLGPWEVIRDGFVGIVNEMDETLMNFFIGLQRGDWTPFLDNMKIWGKSVIIFFEDLAKDFENLAKKNAFVRFIWQAIGGELVGNIAEKAGTLVGNIQTGALQRGIVDKYMGLNDALNSAIFGQKNINVDSTINLEVPVGTPEEQITAVRRAATDAARKTFEGDVEHAMLQFP